MDDYLIDDDQFNLPSTSSAVHHHPASSNFGSPDKRKSQDDKKMLTIINVTDSTPIKSADPSSGMMYTYPNLDSPDYQQAQQQTSDNVPRISYKITGNEFANNVKCIVSTIIFLIVVVAIIFVAVYKNPGM
ncbi:hypothetical protein HELRODRAFT_181467 [Helobdella robusta]|uniref:Uncharacterized protein n=1 Tax=Helobdella robusta TaxID=6412 RepID=T1FH12_HELRO|nr:hypothetical protein HELRODRAFT_181467 [Helobdella robusta]ESN92419.1 hypothetical protein HELRODRAFT_181467 [Helobdella robusta]